MTFTSMEREEQEGEAVTEIQIQLYEKYRIAKKQKSAKCFFKI